MPTQIKKLLKKTTLQFPDNSLPGFEHHLSFLNSLEIPVKLTTVVEAMPHSSNSMAGWQGLQSLTCLGEDRQLYDIDIRYAWGSEIFKQNLVDHGWSEATLLHKKNKQEPTRHKLIIYLCEDSTNLDKNQKIESVPDRFLIGGYWQSIHHIYLLLPVEHPFDIPDSDVKTNMAGYSTTRCLTTNQPTIVNDADSQIASYLFLPNNSERKGEGGLRTKGLWKQSTPEKPLISVITVVFNGAKYIEQTIQSVINQLYDNVEYIIIDGGSTDETLDVIKKYENEIDYWVSESDRGISHAFNKGLLYSSGEWINYINSDDLFCSLSYFSSINLSPNANFIYSKILYDKERITVGRKLPRFLMLRLKFNVPHETVIVSRSLINHYKFPEQMKYAVDYPVLYRCIQKSKKFFHPILSVYMRREGLSFKNREKAHQEIIDFLYDEKDFWGYTIQISKKTVIKFLKTLQVINHYVFSFFQKI